MEQAVPAGADRKREGPVFGGFLLGRGFLLCGSVSGARAADRLHAGDGSAWSEFSSAVAEMKRRVNHTHANFTRLPEKPANAPADEEEAFAVSKEAMENGLAKFFQAISIFDSLNPHNLDVGMMDCGLEALIAGVEETRQVGAAIQRLMSSRM